MQTSIDFDVNALYLWSTGLFTPMGKPCVHHFNEMSNKMEFLYDRGVNEKQITWLAEQ